MKTPRRQAVYNCPVEATMAVIGGKWKSIILYYLLANKVMRFSEFRKTMSTITQQMLTTQLRELEADGLVHREVYPQVPPKVEYTLTPLGATLKPVIFAMKEWGLAYQAAQTREPA